MRGYASGVAHEWLDTTPGYFSFSARSSDDFRATTLMWSGSKIILRLAISSIVWSPRFVRPRALQCGPEAYNGSLIGTDNPAIAPNNASCCGATDGSASWSLSCTSGSLPSGHLRMSQNDPVSRKLAALISGAALPVSPATPASALSN